MAGGKGHVIGPAEDVRRVLEAAVAQHGSQALSNAAIMDGICLDRLSHLPGRPFSSAARPVGGTRIRPCAGFLGSDGTTVSSVPEYVSTQHHPMIISTDNQQLVMAVLIGTNEGDLLSYWKPLQWVQG